MTLRVLPWVRRTAGALAPIVGLVLLAPPAFAEGETTTPQETTVAATAAAKLAAVDASEAIAPVQEPAPAASESDPKAFFKSRKGALALALLAGGVVWTFVSKSQDRVKSPIRFPGE